MLRHLNFPTHLFCILSGIDLLSCQVIWTSSTGASCSLSACFPLCFLRFCIFTPDSSSASRKQSCGAVSRDTTMRQQQKCVWQLCLCVFIHQSAAGLFLPLRTTHTQHPAVRPAVLFAARFSLHFCVNSLRALAAAAEQLSGILRCFFYSLER
jgi:hypothetical protein